MRLTSETGDGTSIRDASETPALALIVDLTPLVQTGPAIATLVTVSFHIMCEPWWPHTVANGLGSLANHWLRRLKELATA